MVAIVACLARWPPHGLMLVLWLAGDSVAGKSRVRAWQPGSSSTSMVATSRGRNADPTQLCGARGLRSQKAF
jgi:hypothetical protein